MSVLGALIVMLVMYVLVPVGLFAAAILAMGGGENFLPRSMRGGAVTRPEHGGDHH